MAEMQDMNTVLGMFLDLFHPAFNVVTDLTTSKNKLN